MSRPGFNAAWWRTICEPSTIRPVWTRRLGATFFGKRGLERSAIEAGNALTRFSHPDTFASASAYIDAVRAVVTHLRLLKELDSTLEFTLAGGVRVADLRYGSSQALVSYAEADTSMARIIARTLDSLPLSGEAILVDVSSPEDLLTALIATRLLRERGQIHYAALVDHGYENFSLSPYLDRLRGAGTLDSIFDAVVEERDHRAVLVPRIVESLLDHRPLRGYLRADDEGGNAIGDPDQWPTSVAPPTPTFAPWPILFTRVSQRRCYWARCTFCVHNLKHTNEGVPSLAEIPRAVQRLMAAADAGYRQAILADEALSPAMLRALGSALLDSRLLQDHPDFRWACRSKMERAHDSDLLATLGRAGCAEILFGLESTSDQVLDLMDKQTRGLTEHEVRRVLSDMDRAGISAHANVIVGFPGDTWDEAQKTVGFLADALAPLRNATYTVNPFALFPRTFIAQDPSRFGIELMPTTDDMPFELPYRAATKAVEGSEAVLVRRGGLEDWLADRLGWRRPRVGDPAFAAQELYFGSGHGMVFKTSQWNPMDRMASQLTGAMYG
jgi:hypothetical protein